MEGEYINESKALSWSQISTICVESSLFQHSPHCTRVLINIASKLTNVWHLFLACIQSGVMASFLKHPRIQISKIIMLCVGKIKYIDCCMPYKNYMRRCMNSKRVDKSQ